MKKIFLSFFVILCLILYGLSMKKEELLIRTHFYKGEDMPMSLGNMVELYWDYERVWVESELGGNGSSSENYKETVSYFQREILKGKPIRPEVPLGLQAIFACRLEHWGGEPTSLDAVNSFIDDYLKTAAIYENK